MKKYQLIWNGNRSNIFYSVTRITLDVEAAEFKRGARTDWTFSELDISSLLINLFQGEFPKSPEFEIIDLGEDIDE